MGGLENTISIDIDVERSIMNASHTRPSTPFFLFGPRVVTPIISEGMAENADRDHVLAPPPLRANEWNGLKGNAHGHKK